MIVEYSADDGLRLSEPNDFRSFKLLVKGGRDEGLPETDGISFVDDHNALIAVSLVLPCPAVPTTRVGAQTICAMVEAARKYGWIDAHANAHSAIWSSA